MRLGVVAALRSELKPTLSALPALHPFVFATSGVGAQRASRAARALPEGLDGILSAGFCGSLTDELAPGDLLLDGSPDLLDLGRRAGPSRTGSITMVDHVVVERSEKESIARRTGALAVDMESAAVGGVAKERGLPFLCVKVVLDTPSRPLACSYSSGGIVTLQILRRPWIIPRMWGDGKRARMAAERLRDFFVALGKEVSPSEG